MKDNYLDSVIKQFRYYKMLTEKTFSQLEEQDLFWQYNEESNSIAIIVNHLRGNMMSRWTDFLTTDGEKEWRNRDLEFEQVIKTRAELDQKWEEGWHCLFSALDSIGDTPLDSLVYIRNQGHSITEAINRQLAHYAYHVGQIVYIGRMTRAHQWKSLSIEKNRSRDYNHEKFSAERSKQHFTDEYLDPGPSESHPGYLLLHSLKNCIMIKLF